MMFIFVDPQYYCVVGGWCIWIWIWDKLS